MKKHSILAFLMVFVLCLTMVMTGCQATKDEEPLTLELAANNTAEALCDFDSSVAVLENMDEKKTVTVSIEDLFTNVLKMDLSNKAFYDELNLTIEGQTANLNLYCNGTDLAVTAPEILGSDQALGVNLKTLVTDLKNSTLWESLDGDGEVSSVWALVMEVMDQYETIAEDLTIDEEALCEDLSKALEGMESSQEEGTATIYGETVDAVIFTYIMDEADIQAVLDVILEYSEESYDKAIDAMVNTGLVLREDIEAQGNIYAEAREELDAAFETVELDGTLKISVNPENRCIMSVDAACTGTAEDSSAECTMALVFGKDPANTDKITLTLAANSDEGDTIGLEAVLSNTTEGTVDTTAFTVEVSEGDESETLAITCIYDSDSHNYELALDVAEEHYAAYGLLENTDSKLTFTIDELEASGSTQTLGLTITVESTPDCEIPEVPEYVNILTDIDLSSMLFGYTEDEVYAEDEAYWEDESWDDETWDEEYWDDETWEDESWDDETWDDVTFEDDVW